MQDGGQNVADDGASGQLPPGMGFHETSTQPIMRVLGRPHQHHSGGEDSSSESSSGDEDRFMEFDSSDEEEMADA